MRSLAILLAFCLAACDGQREPERGVDTSPLGAEGVAKGIIAGSLTYPSDGLPDDIDVCAETLDGKTQHCGAQIAGTSYTLEAPVGQYRVYAYRKSDPRNRAYYSQFVRCGYDLNCSSHEPITVSVAEDETVGEIEPGDWYANAAAEPAEAVPVEEDDEADYDPAAETGTEDGVTSAPAAAPQYEASRARARGSIVNLFSTDDYPPSALRNDEQGTTGVRITIGPDGRVWSCAVIASSGSASLDTATCSIIQRRARFAPARDESGNAVADTVDQRIRWELPPD